MKHEPHGLYHARLPQTSPPLRFTLQVNHGVYTSERWSNRPIYCQEIKKATFISTFIAIGGLAIDKSG
jgi:hypothetical protein